MRVFVAGASGAIGTRLVPQLIDARSRGDRHLPVARKRRAATGARGGGGRASTCSTARRARGRARSQARRDRPPGDSARGRAASAETSTARSRRPTGCGPRAPTRSSPRRARPACAGSSRRASPLTATRAKAGRSRPRTIRSTPPRPRRCTRPTPRCATSIEQSPTPAESRCATAASTARPTTGWSDPCASGSSRSSATARGVSSFIHLDDAAAATVLALDHDGAGIYNIVDDEPAPMREWLPVLAQALGAKPPRTVPRWLARLSRAKAAW